MSHAHHEPSPDVTRLALDATRHCLTGCAIGEVVGLLISGAVGLSTQASIVAGIVLAFVLGYSFTFVPLLRGGMTLDRAVGVTLAADTISIVVMEAVDNLIVRLVPARWLRVSTIRCSGPASRSASSSRSPPRSP